MTPELLDALGHVGYVSLMAGTWLLGRRRSGGWVLRAAGSVLWGWIGWEMAMPSIWIWSAVFLAADLRGFWIATASPESRSRDASSDP